MKLLTAASFTTGAKEQARTEKVNMVANSKISQKKESSNTTKTVRRKADLDQADHLDIMQDAIRMYIDAGGFVAISNIDFNGGPAIQILVDGVRLDDGNLVLLAEE